MIASKASQTRIDEIADGVYRIATPVDNLAGGFSFNQFLLVDDEPLLFHTGPRKLFPVVCEAISRVIPVERLRHIRSRITKPMSAARSTNSSATRRPRRRCTAASPQWCSITTSPTARPVPSPTARRCRSAATRCMARHAAFAACLGCRVFTSATTGTLLCQRSLTEAARSSAGDPERYPRTERTLSPGPGLLRHTPNGRAILAKLAAEKQRSCAHARQRLAR